MRSPSAVRLHLREWDSWPMDLIDGAKGSPEPPNILHLVGKIMFWRVDAPGASMSLIAPMASVVGVDADIPHSSEFLKGPSLIGIFVILNIL